MDVSILSNDILVTILDENNITATIVPNNITGQAALMFQDEGLNLGDQGTATVVNFVGAGVVASRSGGTVTVNVSSSGGGGTWGSITGTLSNQTDLQSALDAKGSLAGSSLFLYYNFY